MLFRRAPTGSFLCGIFLTRNRFFLGVFRFRRALSGPKPLFYWEGEGLLRFFLALSFDPLGVWAPHLVFDNPSRAEPGISMLTSE